ncbi:MAG: hypothetical protein ACI8PZ_001089 [Myxococcota bacterium]|jgi:hypothetical protein
MHHDPEQRTRGTSAVSRAASLGVAALTGRPETGGILAPRIPRVRPEPMARRWSTEDMFSVALLGCAVVCTIGWLAFA